MERGCWWNEGHNCSWELDCKSPVLLLTSGCPHTSTGGCEGRRGVRPPGIFRGCRWRHGPRGGGGVVSPHVHPQHLLSIFKTQVLGSEEASLLNTLQLDHSQGGFWQFPCSGDFMNRLQASLKYAKQYFTLIACYILDCLINTANVWLRVTLSTGFMWFLINWMWMLYHSPVLQFAVILDKQHKESHLNKRLFRFLQLLQKCSRIRIRNHDVYLLKFYV